MFTCILPDYVTYEIQKEFWKNSHFENTRTCFLLRCQNSLRQNSPKMMHFQAWKKKDFNQYYVVAFDPIKIYTYLALQNDLLNLIFVKDIYVVGKKMAFFNIYLSIFQVMSIDIHLWPIVKTLGRIMKNLRMPGVLGKVPFIYYVSTFIAHNSIWLIFTRTGFFLSKQKNLFLKMTFWRKYSWYSWKFLGHKEENKCLKNISYEQPIRIPNFYNEFFEYFYQFWIKVQIHHKSC